MNEKKKVIVIDAANVYNENDNNYNLIRQRSFKLCQMIVEAGHDCTYISYYAENIDNVTCIRIKYPEEIISLIKTLKNSDVIYDLYINNGYLEKLYELNSFFRKKIKKNVTIIDSKLEFGKNEYDCQVIKSNIVIFPNDDIYKLSERNLSYAPNDIDVRIIGNDEDEKYIDLINELLG